MGALLFGFYILVIALLVGCAVYSTGQLIDDLLKIKDGDPR